MLRVGKEGGRPWGDEGVPEWGVEVEEGREGGREKAERPGVRDWRDIWLVVWRNSCWKREAQGEVEAIVERSWEKREERMPLLKEALGPSKASGVRGRWAE